jgi:hypothetical protein
LKFIPLVLIIVIIILCISFVEQSSDQAAGVKPPIPPSIPIEPEKPQFKVGTKLEAVDRRFPYYVCVATIADKIGKEVLIHFDDWDDSYDYWCSVDDVELHPVGWCDRNNWTLQKPKGS